MAHHKLVPSQKVLATDKAMLIAMVHKCAAFKSFSCSCVRSYELVVFVCCCLRSEAQPAN